MGKRGPKPTPTPTLKMRGSWLARVRGDEVQFGGDLPQPPAHLDDAAVAEWRRIIPHLEPHGFAAPAYLATLAEYCQAWADVCRLIVQVRAEGIAIEGWRVNPHWRALQDARGNLNKATAKLGLSPADKAGLQAKPIDKTTDEKKRYAI